MYAIRSYYDTCGKVDRPDDPVGHERNHFATAFEHDNVVRARGEQSFDASEAVGAPGVYRGAEVSPGGERVALHRHDEAGGDVWVIEPGNSLRRITFDPAQDNS